MLKNDTIYWIWYSAIKGIGSSAKIKLLDGVASPKEIFRTRGECLLKNNISAAIINKIRDAATAENIDRFIPMFDKHDDIGIVTYFDFDYPRLLCEIKNPPLVLYYKGDISLLNKRCIAVVGTRKATQRGTYHARSFSRELAANDIVVVSGMATGIDSAAHMGALGVGSTCAVLACGVDVVYPAENKELYNRICDEGVVVSEYMPGTPPIRTMFPARNRIISGLSESVLLVEAPKRSGAMITVDHALEQNRDVFVLLDNTDSIEYSGNRELINDGAVAVTNPYDMINTSEYTAYDSLKIEFSHIKAAEPVVDETSVEEKDYSELNEDEIEIINLIKKGINQFDELSEKSGKDAASLGYILTMLEFKGFVEQKIGKVYEEV